jgi:menaquinone-dependent protoporphyrinogen oxidase
MSTLIVYASSHGCTEKAALALEQQLKDSVTLANLKKDKNIDPTYYDTVIIGGSIHAGQVQKVVKRFCSQHLDTLKQKRVGLFLSCMEEGEKAQQQFDNAFPGELRNHAAVTGLFGGEFDFEKMNFLQRAIVKKVAGITENVSKVKEENIRQFSDALNG